MMNICIENTMHQYEILYAMPEEKREDYFRYTMMGPFAEMWKTIHVPMKASHAGAYDIMMATRMLGYLDVNETEIGQAGLKKLQDIGINRLAGQTLHYCIDRMGEAGLRIGTESLRFGAYLANPQKLAYTKGYSGFGGIPGYIQLMIYPNDYNIPRIPAILAHELHHNIRFSYFDWDHGNISVGDYIIVEGLADSFASALYGESMLGPWATSFDGEDLFYSIEVIRQALEVKGFAEVSSYMFGDEIAREQGYPPAGLSFGAGYAVGYYTVQQFLKNSGATIYEATRMPAAEILEGSRIF